MAVIRYGAVVQDARGSIGGLTFARNHGTSCIRQRPLKVNYRTPLVEESRRRYAFVVAAWSDLTDDERQTWIGGAAVGNQSGAWGVGKQLSGFQLFCRVNLQSAKSVGSVTREWLPVSSGAPLMTGILQALPGGPLRVVQSLYSPGYGVNLVVRAQLQNIGRAGRARRMWRGLGAWSPDAQAMTVKHDGRDVVVGLEANSRIRWEVRGAGLYFMGGNVTSGDLVLPNISHAWNSDGGFEGGTLGAVPVGWSYSGTGQFREWNAGQWCDYRCARWDELAAGGTGQAVMSLTGGLVAGHRYRLNFWAGNASGGINEIFIYEAGGNHLVLSSGFTPPSTGYTEYTFEAVATVDSPSPVVVWQCYSGAARTIFIDECYFTEVYD